MWARTLVELLLPSWPRALPSFLRKAYVKCSFVPEYCFSLPGGGGDLLEKELPDGLDRIHHLTMDDIGEHWNTTATLNYPHQPCRVYSAPVIPLPPSKTVLEVPQISANGVTVYLFFGMHCGASDVMVLPRLRTKHVQIVLTYNGISTPPWLHHGSCAGCKCPHGPGKQVTQRMAERKYKPIHTAAT